MAEAKSTLAFGRAALNFDLNESDYLVMMDEGIDTFEAMAYRFPASSDLEDYMKNTIRVKAGYKEPSGSNGVRKLQTQVHEKYRVEAFSTHQCIMLPQEEKHSDERGRLNFCKVCLSRLGQGTPEVQKLTCQQRRERLNTNPWVRKMKRDWWERVQVRDPDWARNFLVVSGWKQDDLEKLLAPRYKSEAKRRAGEKRKEKWKAQKKNKH